MGLSDLPLEHNESQQDVRLREIMRLLKNTQLFSHLEPGELADFMDAAKTRQAEKGKILYLQNEPSEFFYVIRSGWVKLFRETLDGEEAVIDILTTGHVFGETSVFEDGLHSCNAQVVEDAQLIVLPSSLLREKTQVSHTFALNMLAAMSHHRRHSIEELEHLTVQSAPQRIGCFLLRLCNSQEEGEVTLHLPYDKTLIAARLGMKPETFSRALTRLRQESDIDVKGATVSIPDIQRLVGYTCNACSNAYPCKDL